MDEPQAKPEQPSIDLPPIMDVKPPQQPATQFPEPKINGLAAPTTHLKEPVLPIEPNPLTEEPKKQSQNKEHDAPITHASIPQKSSKPGTGAGVAIFATIIIVLGLGALVTYAYLRTNGISAF